MKHVKLFEGWLNEDTPNGSATSNSFWDEVIKLEPQLNSSNEWEDEDGKMILPLDDVISGVTQDDSDYNFWVECENDQYSFCAEAYPNNASCTDPTADPKEFVERVMAEIASIVKYGDNVEF